MPIEDREIFGCANFMIEEHGEEATFHAALRADELHEAGDLDGQRTWQRIIRAIATLESNGEGQLRH